MHSRTNLYSESAGCYTNVVHCLNLAATQSENFVWEEEEVVVVGKMLTDPGRDCCRVSTHTWRQDTHSTTPFKKEKEKERKPHTALQGFLTKLGSLLNGAASQGHGDDNDVYED